MLTFDRDAHEYRWNGKLVPNVTTILASAGPSPYRGRLPLERGQAVHLAVLYSIEDDLDESTLPEIAVPYFAGFKKFMAETGFRPDVSRCERPMYNSKLGFAGTPDLIGKLNGCWALIDVKTGSLGQCGPQTAAYSTFFTLAGLKRFGLLLRKDGKYKLERYEDPRDMAAFLSALKTYREAA